MKTGLDIMAERGMDMSAKQWDEKDFNNARLPMVVECRSCTSTLALPTAILDEENYTYCSEECCF